MFNLIRIHKRLLFERDKRVCPEGCNLLLDFPESFELTNGVVVAATVGKLVTFVALRKMLG